MTIEDKITCRSTVWNLCSFLFVLAPVLGNQESQKFRIESVKVHGNLIFIHSVFYLYIYNIYMYPIWLPHSQLWVIFVGETLWGWVPKLSGAPVCGLNRKPSESNYNALTHLAILPKNTYNRKKRGLEQNPVEHLFELPECLRYDCQLIQIVHCFLGMMQTICNSSYTIIV